MLRVNALPDMVDDQISCEFLYGVSKKVAGRVFNQPAWDASKNESGFVHKSHLIDPRALEKAVVLGEILRFGAKELGECDVELRSDQDFMERCIEIDQGSEEREKGGKRGEGVRFGPFMTNNTVCSGMLNRERQTNH
jgi:hypothetical protein